MEKIIVALSIISALFLAGYDTKKNVNSDMQENNSNQNQESIANSGENTSGEYKLYSEFKNITLDLTQPISISELLERNKLEIQSNQKHELNLGEFKIGNNSGELSISVKNQLVVKINGNIVHEYEANLIDCATLVMFKNYIICTDNYDFAGGYAYVFNEYGEKVYEFFTDHEKIKVENDVVLYSIYQGKLLEKSEEGIGTFARGHYELREQNGVFTEKLINIDENDLNNFTIIN